MTVVRRSKLKPQVLWAYDTQHLYWVQKAAAQKGGTGRPTDYEALASVLRSETEGAGVGSPSVVYAPVALDPRSDSQRRFVDALRGLGIAADPIDYRHTFVSLPGGPHGDRLDKPVSTLAPWLIHAVGLMARHAEPTVVVVSGGFEPYWPLLDFVNNRGGRAFIAFFRRYLDARWTQFAALGEAGSPIGWIDLEPAAAEILGCEFASPGGSAEAPGTGLGAIM